MHRSIFVIFVGLLLSISSEALAQTSDANGGAPVFNALDTFWIVFAAVLVFFMQAGFGLVEAGLVRAKNAGNILMKNLMDFAIASLAFFALGYAVMWGEGNAIIGAEGWFLLGVETPVDGVPLYAFWLFQAAFAGAAATIVAGGCRRTHEVYFVSPLYDCDLRGRLPDGRPLGLGRRMAVGTRPTTCRSPKAAAEQAPPFCLETWT